MNYWKTYKQNGVRTLRLLREVSMTNESARGHAKNARNQVHSMLVKLRADELPRKESAEYALQEIKTALDEMES